MNAALRRIIAGIVADDLETHGEAHPAQVARRVRTEYYAEFADDAFACAEDQVRDVAHKFLSDRTRARAEQLPGFELPAVYTASDGEGGFRYVTLSKATMADFAADCEVRRLNVVAATSEWQFRVIGYERLMAAPGVHDAMRILDAVKRLSS